MKYTQWEGFKGTSWQDEVNVRDFIQQNYTPYEGDDSFLAAASESTNKLWAKVMDLTKQERAKGGVLDADESIVSWIDSHGAGYIDKDLETIVGVQTDAPFKRAFMPFGGIKMAVKANEAYGYGADPKVVEIFEKYRKTHNQGVYDAYDAEQRLAKKVGIITGLPDTYGRGRIIGDYRRVALYGIDFLKAEKLRDYNNTGKIMSDDVIRLREELNEQYKALDAMKRMAAAYGHDISKPAANAKEAIQWLYYGYLAAIKQNNGAAMSFGRNAGFLDIFIQRDIQKGLITEAQAQEMIDHLVMKLRIVKFMRPEEYNQLFSGDPVWATESVGGQGIDGRTLVTKTAFRFIHTLSTMGPAPEPNITVLWSKNLPDNFKNFVSKYSILYSSLQYENDDIMRSTHGDDYAIACCVSPMKVGKQMQFFGARCNLPKALLYTINGGIDEKAGVQVSPRFESAIRFDKNGNPLPLDFKEVWDKLDGMLEWLAGLYVNVLNVIHYMHDKYYYESAQMALYDRDVERFFATGIAGLSVIADSLSAIKFAKVTPVMKPVMIKNEKTGEVTEGPTIAKDFIIEGDFPKYGNDDDRVDSMAVEVTKMFMNKIKKNKTYRNGIPTMSVLTITSNVVYGKKTGATPDGRPAGAPFAPGANPMHNRDANGAIASLSSVAKIPFKYAADGISNTFSIVPGAIGKEDEFTVMGDIELKTLRPGSLDDMETTLASANDDGKYNDK